MNKPEFLGFFPNYKALVEAIGFIDFSHHTPTDNSCDYYAGPLTQCDGKKFIECYIGQGDCIYVSIEDFEVWFPRDSSRFLVLTEDMGKGTNEASQAAVKYPLGKSWQDFVKYE